MGAANERYKGIGNGDCQQLLCIQMTNQQERFSEKGEPLLLINC